MVENLNKDTALSVALACSSQTDSSLSPVTDESIDIYHILTIFTKRISYELKFYSSTTLKKISAMNSHRIVLRCFKLHEYINSQIVRIIFYFTKFHKSISHDP